MKKAISVVLALGLTLALTVVAFAAENQMTVYSDTNVMVYGPLTEYKPVGDPAWGAAQNALATWVHPSWPTILGATWISTSYQIENARMDSWRWFSKTVDLCEGATNVSGFITATSDNAEEVYVNGSFRGSDGEVQGSFVDNQEWNTIKIYLFEPGPVDTLQLDFIVRNYAYNTDNYQTNPTGLIFDATIDYDCNLPPVANPNGPYLGAVGSSIPFNGSGSSDPDGDLLTYDWDFGDTSTGIGATPTHSYATPGTYDVCLTVNDGFVDSFEECTSAVVYDPSGGFVTGGGWIESQGGSTAPIFNSIPETMPGSFPSLGYEATSTDEAGDHIAFAGTDRALNSIRVSLTNWACENDFNLVGGTWVPNRNGTEACVTTPGTGFDHPITLNIYDVDNSGSTPAVGALIASKTETFFIPFRPSWDSTMCGDPSTDVPFGGTWYDPVLGACVHGYAFNIDFDFSADGITLPDEVIYGVAYNTGHHGNTPLGVNGPYNSLNLSLTLDAPMIGTDAESGTLFYDTSYGPFYCDSGAGGTDIFRRDAGCWDSYTPVVQFNIQTEGAYKLDQSLEGKATFGFVSKYKKGATVPDGNTEFQFKAGDLNFHSTSYEWLVVNQGGTNAQFKGYGTINGAGNYGFMLWAGDGAPDTFRIKIWDATTEVVVYDNGPDQAIGGGSIVVHKK